MTIPRRFEPLSCSLERLRASMKMSNFERKCSPEYRHVICIGKTKSTSQKGLLEKTSLLWNTKNNEQRRNIYGNPKLYFQVLSLRLAQWQSSYVTDISKSTIIRLNGSVLILSFLALLCNELALP